MFNTVTGNKYFQLGSQLVTAGVVAVGAWKAGGYVYDWATGQKKTTHTSKNKSHTKRSRTHRTAASR